ncbi:MAG: NYN domain-containing protein [Clostridia bacterium]|nr:NYN domain-containing protein [Clostridia bacterium]
MKKITVGVLAHVDSGKTTLSEAMLYLSGTIRKLGRVDHKNTYLDTNKIERDRGITIFSKQAELSYNGNKYTLLDTPGHVDFSSEMERTLQVLDYAVLLINGSDGVQSHTETLWSLLKRYRVPTFIFINKMDIASNNKEALYKEIREKLSESAVDIVKAYNENDLESIAEISESLMNEYLDTMEIGDESIIKAINNRELFPLFFGSALKPSGVDELLKYLDRFTEEKEYKKEFGALVYKITEDEQNSRLTHIKLTGGSLNVKDIISYQNKQGEAFEEKINGIRIYSGQKYKSVESVSAGDICAVTGITKALPGQGIGAEDSSVAPLLEPVLTYKIILPQDVNLPDAIKKLHKLSEEDPQLHLKWVERLKEIHAEIMGEVQLEVLKRLISERFNMDVSFGNGSILYKETIKNKVEGVGHFEPLRHYAEVHLILEPLKPGEGLKFETDCREEVLEKNWQRLILTHLQEKTHLGVLTGSPITDMKITVASGRAHLKHTEGGDFREATYRAVRQGLAYAESLLLEPYYDFKITVPMDMVGRVITDIGKMCGEFTPQEIEGTMAVIRGSVPVSTSINYPHEVIRFTKGQGRCQFTLKGYFPCHNSEEVIPQFNYNFETDVENTPDSVFCSHGAGYVVKWDQVYSKMHLESALSEKKVKFVSSTEGFAYKPREVQFSQSLESDKELLDIFERTYGKIKQDPRIGFAERKKAPPKESNYTRRVPLPPEGPEYLLVDGYNIIFAWERLKKLSESDIEAARDKLISILSNYSGYKKNKVILVFDAYKVKGGIGSVETVGGISVVYTKEAETADMYIEKVTHEIGRKYRVRVATSDALEQMIILGHGAMRVSANMLLEEITETEKEIRSLIKK